MGQFTFSMESFVAVGLLVLLTLGQAAADVCGLHRTCSACATASCVWCGLYARDDVDTKNDLYQGFGVCQAAGAQCDATDSVFANLHDLFHGEWASEFNERLVAAVATAKELSTADECPSNDPQVDENTFDLNKQSCSACVGGNTGSGDEPVWVKAAVFAHGANGVENNHRGGYCIDKYDDSRWPLRYPLATKHGVLYSVGAFIQLEEDCGEDVVECDIQEKADRCERYVGKTKLCHMWLNVLKDKSGDTFIHLHRSYCQVPYMDHVESLYQRTGLKPFLTVDFGEGIETPKLSSVQMPFPPADLLAFRYGLDTCEKCLAYKAEKTKWCQSTMTHSKSDIKGEGGACNMLDGDSCEVANGKLDEATISSVAVTDCAGLPTTTTTTAPTITTTATDTATAFTATTDVVPTTTSSSRHVVAYHSSIVASVLFFSFSGMF